MPDKKLTLGFLIIFLVLFYPAYKQSHYSGENINKFRDLTISSPLLYDPSTNADYLKREVDNLAAEDRRIKSTNEKYIKKTGEKNALPKAWSLWPNRFLKTLPQIHDATNVFLENPDSKKANTLLNLYARAIREYKKAISLNIEALEGILESNPDLGEKKILFLGSATTAEVVLNDFKLILENSGELEKEIEKRKSCLKKGECVQRNKSSDSDITIIQTPYEPLSDKVLGIEPGEVKFGPFRAETNCFGVNPAGVYSHPFFLVEKTARNQKIIVNPMLANTKHYRNYELIPDQNIARLWLQEGVKIRPHSGLNDYLCTDLRYLPEIYSQYLKAEDNNMLAAMPYLVTHTLSTADSLIYEMNFRQKPLDPLYFLINRSAYSLYFGTFSDSIWLLNKKPQFLIPEDFSNDARLAGYITYEDLISKDMTEEEIVKLNSLPRLDSIYKDPRP